jgi:predicted lipoprotein with Yx(FWY)xxD motif
VLATGSGYTLYDFAPDTPTASACVSTVCVLEWPPLTIDPGATVRLGHGLQAKLAGTLRRPDGSEQVTYDGHPLYRWNGDVAPGMITGQAIDNAGGLWYVLRPSGAQVLTPFSVTRSAGP